MKLPCWITGHKWSTWIDWEAKHAERECLKCRKKEVIEWQYLKKRKENYSQIKKEDNGNDT